MITTFSRSEQTRSTLFESYLTRIILNLPEANTHVHKHLHKSHVFCHGWLLKPSHYATLTVRSTMWDFRAVWVLQEPKDEPGPGPRRQRSCRAPGNCAAETQRCYHSQPAVLVVEKRKKERRRKMASSCLFFFWLTLLWLFSLSLIISDLTCSVSLLSFKLRWYDGVSKLLTNKHGDLTCSTIYARSKWQHGCFEWKLFPNTALNWETYSHFTIT